MRWSPSGSVIAVPTDTGITFFDTTSEHNIQVERVIALKPFNGRDNWLLVQLVVSNNQLSLPLKGLHSIQVERVIALNPFNSRDNWLLLITSCLYH